EFAGPSLARSVEVEAHPRLVLRKRVERRRSAVGACDDIALGRLGRLAKACPAQRCLEMDAPVRAGPGDVRRARDLASGESSHDVGDLDLVAREVELERGPVEGDAVHLEARARADLRVESLM